MAFRQALRPSLPHFYRRELKLPTLDKKFLDKKILDKKFLDKKILGQKDFKQKNS